MVEIQDLREEVIELLITKRDYEIILKLFDREESPGYSIVKAEEHETDFMLVQLYVNSIGNLWYLAKKVQVILDYLERQKGDTKKEA